MRGAGVAVSTFVAGSTGFDGLFVVKPDGKLYVQSGVGNLGTESVFDVHRPAAEMLGIPWENVVVAWGDTSQHLPWTCVSGGSQTTHAMTRAAHAAASDAIAKAKEIAARKLGGSAESYRVAGGRVSGGGGLLSLAQVAALAVEMGGKYDGHELPENINKVTTASATALAGQGLMGVARDTYPRDGTTPVVRGRLRRSGSGRRDRRLQGARLHRGRRLRHHRPPALLRRPAARPFGARHGPRAGAEDGLRPALRRRPGDADVSEPAADHPRHPAQHAVGRA